MRFHRVEVLVPDIHGWSPSESWDALREALDGSGASAALIGEMTVVETRPVDERRRSVC